MGPSDIDYNFIEGYSWNSLPKEYHDVKQIGYYYKESAFAYIIKLANNYFIVKNIHSGKYIPCGRSYERAEDMRRRVITKFLSS